MTSSLAPIKILFLAAAAAFFGGGAVVPTHCLNFNFPNFTTRTESELIMHNHARIFYDAIQVTPDVRGAPITNESGRAIYKNSFLIRNRDKIASFNTTFELNISPITTPVGGEGLAFILAGDHHPPADSFGQWLGIVNSSTNGTSQAKILAVEFDTRKNFPADIDSNHVGLNLNSVLSIEQHPLMEFGVNLSSGSSVFAVIQYDGENISVFVTMSNKTEDHLKNRVIFHRLNLSVLPDEVFVGFSGSTSNFTQLNCVKSWAFNGVDIGDGGRTNRLWIWLTVAGIGSLVIFGAVFGILFKLLAKKRRLRNDPDESYEGIEHQLQDFSITPRAQKFGFRELKKATNNFDTRNRLGKGGFGTVYKGNLMNRDVAVKRISEDSRQGKQEFIAEVATIGSLHHKNLVKLIGWCYEKRDLLLVYEYMPNGSLDKLMFGKIGGVEMLPNWETRLNIISGVAEALDYLHNGCEKTVLHRDVKTSNIMLDSKFEAKLGDFGLARTMRRTDQTHHSTREIAGTPGYMAPEIFLTSRATAETDVYAYGILVLEVLCGRKPGNPLDLGSYEGSIAHWVWEFHTEERLVEAVDESIEGKVMREEIEYLLILGLACCHPNPLQRPTIRNVLQVLKGEANPPILPIERPSFVWPPMPPSFKEGIDSSLKDSQLTPFTDLSGR